MSYDKPFTLWVLMDPAIATIISFLLVSDIIIASGFSLSTTHLTPQNVKSCMFCLLSWFSPSISILTQHVSPGEDFLALLHLPHYGKWPLIRAFCRSLSSVFYLADSAVEDESIISQRSYMACYLQVIYDPGRGNAVSEHWGSSAVLRNINVSSCSSLQ